MNKEKPEIPDDEDNPFLSLGNLLGKVSVATLATAIDKHEIYTWDGYGRFGLTDEAGKDKAFHLLRMHYEWESTPPQERSNEDPRSPMEQWGSCGDNAYEHFGWATKVLPDFDSIELTPIEVPSRPGAPIKRKAPDAFVAALTKLLVEIAKRNPSLNITEMPGLKADLHELAKKLDAEFICKPSTFDTYIGPFCQFKQGARHSSYYREHFEHLFK